MNQQRVEKLLEFLENEPICQVLCRYDMKVPVYPLMNEASEVTVLNPMPTCKTSLH